MNQHLSSMLEHLSSLRRKNSESTQATSSDKQTADNDHQQKDVSDVETMSRKTKSIFRDLISDNSAATNIFQNLNFIKCTSSTTTVSSNLNTTPSVGTSSNGTCKQQEQLQQNGSDDDNSNQQCIITTTVSTNLLHPTTNETNNMHNRKRNSVTRMFSNGSNGDLSMQRELSPISRPHRKSSHDIRLLRNMQDGNSVGETQDMGKSTTVVKPLKTKHIITRNETFDTLHCRAMDVSRFKI